MFHSIWEHWTLYSLHVSTWILQGIMHTVRSNISIRWFTVFLISHKIGFRLEYSNLSSGNHHWIGSHKQQHRLVLEWSPHISTSNYRSSVHVSHKFDKLETSFGVDNCFHGQKKIDHHLYNLRGLYCYHGHALMVESWKVSSTYHWWRTFGPERLLDYEYLTFFVPR